MIRLDGRERGETPGAYIARRAIECQGAAMMLCPHDYRKRVAEWRDLLTRLAAAHGWSLTDAVYSLAFDLRRARPGDSAAIMWLFAAFAEEALAATEPKGVPA